MKPLQAILITFLIFGVVTGCAANKELEAGNDVSAGNILKGPVPITVMVGDDIPSAVVDYATEYIRYQIDYHNRGGMKSSYSITEGRITGLSPVNTGTADLVKNISLWLLEYRLLLDNAAHVSSTNGIAMEQINGRNWITEWGSLGQPYLLLVLDYETESWRPICVTSTDVISLLLI